MEVSLDFDPNLNRSTYQSLRIESIQLCSFPHLLLSENLFISTQFFFLIQVFDSYWCPNYLVYTLFNGNLKLMIEPSTTLGDSDEQFNLIEYMELNGFNPQIV